MNHEAIKNLVARTFPFIEPKEIEQMLFICNKNNGLCSAAEGFVFGYFFYRPELVQLVDAADWDSLLRMDLRAGPILHIAVLVTPTAGYRLLRDCITSLNPRAVSAHRVRPDGTKHFSFVRNRRRIEVENAYQH